MNFLFDLANNVEDEDFNDSKEDVLKYLKIIGVDTRFISYTPDKIFINNLRFSKFSRTRQNTFEKHYGNIEVVRSSLFQKICAKSAKHLTNEIKPNQRILISKDDYLSNLVLEPYTRKYGVELVYGGNYDLVANPLILDEKVNGIFSSIFAGEGLDFSKKENEIYPLINVPLKWVNSFLESENKKIIRNESGDELATSFMEFLEEVSPQYRENVLNAYEFIESKIKQ